MPRIEIASDRRRAYSAEFRAMMVTQSLEPGISHPGPRATQRYLREPDLSLAAGVTFPEPDVTNCGGVTVFMKIAHRAEAHNLPLTSHGVHNLTVHLLASVPNRSYLEVHGFGLDRFIAEPLVIRNGNAVASDRPGHGVEFDWPRLTSLQD